MPVVNAGQIRFRREMRPFQPFHLETRILTWSETHVVMKHRLASRTRDGSPIVNAIALVKAGLYDRAAKSYVPMGRLLDENGLAAEPPEATPEVQAFLHAEEALKRAA
ncbi:thioesterase family protein [Microvirga makkahensis]|uniref:thioesterase family protein n=1 Tax=Microvirga makkahensis TaxID=1128670 RepID=UPI0031B59BB0